MMNEKDIHDYQMAYQIIASLENSDEVKAGARNSFSVVRNFLANKIATWHCQND